jgi:hypothetical protein
VDRQKPGGQRELRRRKNGAANEGVLMMTAVALINLKKSVELIPAKNIQHKLDRQMKIMWCI